jgi:aminoglycoside phosphotransferase (APT) family kinase protein
VDHAPEMESRLHDFVAAQLSGVDDLRIEGLRRASTGYSRENWLFDAEWTDPATGDAVHERLILRRDPIGSVLETSRAQEHAVLQALQGGPIPTPRTLWLDATGDHLGRPAVVMERYEGVCDIYALEGGRSQLPADQRVALARSGIGMLAQVHMFDWRSTALAETLPDPGRHGARAAIAEWKTYLARQVVEPHPELTAVVCWLERNAPEAQATVLVHGDWKPGNWLIADGKIVVALDWETAHLGDPLEDVGWITNPLRHREHIIPGLWERADLIAHYEACTGFTVDEAAVRFWNVLANFKLAAITLTGVRSLVDGRADRVWTGSRGIQRLLLQMID